MRKILVDLISLGGDPANDIGTLIKSDLTTTFILAADPQEGTGSTVLSDALEGPAIGAAMATTGVATAARIYLDPKNLTSENNATLALVSHENRHAFHLVTGTRIVDSEVQGLRGENATRDLLKMPIRLRYGAVLFTWNEVVPWWVKRK
jgi:hypothetical protein